MFKTKLNLRNVIAIAICLTTTTLFSGCSNDDNPPAISVADNSSLTQVVYANNVQGNSGVSFTTTGAWTSSTSADWISISPNNGSSEGNYTVGIILAINTTGADRTATVSILCNGDRITIYVTQKGKTEDGEVPNEEAEIRRLLVKLYHDTQGDSWYNNENWLSNKPINEWYGVTYSIKNFEIFLQGQNLRGRIDLSGCSSLTFLDCDDNQLISLNVSGCSALTELACERSLLATLNVNGCTSLEGLYCEGNKLASLNVSGCSTLRRLHCDHNQLTNINLNGCVALYRLDCGDNHLTNTALDSVFEVLPYFSYPEGRINVRNNPGTATCNPNIAEAKGWTVDR